MARTYGGRDSRRLRRFLWASRGPVAGAEGLLDLLAGDLVAAGYAVRVDGEQDMHAVPGAGSDLGGRGAGGQPQRQRGMAQVVGARWARICDRGGDLLSSGSSVGLSCGDLVLVDEPAEDLFRRIRYSARLISGGRVGA